MVFLPKLLEFLRSNGAIYTVRGYRYGASTILVTGVGSCSIERVVKGACKEDLVPYIASSGFDTLEEWWDKVLMFNPDPYLSVLCLYKVTVIRRTG